MDLKKKYTGEKQKRSEEEWSKLNLHPFRDALQQHYYCLCHISDLEKIS